jgi:hypothetical protein
VLRFKTSSGYTYYETLTWTLERLSSTDWSFLTWGPYYFPPLGYTTIEQGGGFQVTFDDHSKTYDIDAFVRPSDADILDADSMKTTLSTGPGLIAWTDNRTDSCLINAGSPTGNVRCTPMALKDRSIVAFTVRADGRRSRYDFTEPLKLGGQSEIAKNFIKVGVGQLGRLPRLLSTAKQAKPQCFEIKDTWFCRPDDCRWVQVIAMYCNS